MTEIEWLDADGRPLAPPPPDAPPEPGGFRARFDLRRAAPWLDLGWLVSAALAVAAPFFDVYRLHLGETAQQVDGWGRYHSAVNSAEGAGAHGIRFGVVTCVAAGLIVLAVAVRRIRPFRPRIAALALVVSTLGAGVLAATAATAWLDADALFDSVRSELDTFGAVQHVESSLHFGAGVWTTVAAAAVGLVTLVGEAFRRPRAAQHSGAAPTAVSDPDAGPRPLGPGDEPLA
ncbi:hypothetical protein [Jatrophihabitans endophyticus]|uniref:hypothetical protein n=1 Tax=Jatrophihabitans endophyticus TaxID=1206085 RepID=UPI001A096E08|nr:hypothetical protein [Jatrophihabitans endophyticus]MBE7189967.1 hypothetical protein [Jatrophihabitans endophyticus]